MGGRDLNACPDFLWDFFTIGKSGKGKVMNWNIPGIPQYLPRVQRVKGGLLFVGNVVSSCIGSVNKIRQ